MPVSIGEINEAVFEDAFIGAEVKTSLVTSILQSNPICTNLKTPKILFIIMEFRTSGIFGVEDMKDSYFVLCVTYTSVITLDLR